MRLLLIFCIFLQIFAKPCLQRNNQIHVNYPYFTSDQKHLEEYHIGQGQYRFKYDISHPIKFLQNNEIIPIQKVNPQEIMIDVKKNGPITFFNPNHPLEMAGTITYNQKCTPLGYSYGGGGGSYYYNNNY